MIALRERRSTVTLVTMTCALMLAASGCGGSSSHSTTSNTTAAKSSNKNQIVTARVAAWHLPFKVSRTTAVAQGTQLLTLGGLVTGDVSTSSVIAIDTTSGVAQTAGNLAQKLHDAAGTSMNNAAFVFGGGEATTKDVVQQWSAATGTVVGHLPTPRSDLSAVSINGTSFILGGFTGTGLSSDVLSTRDGQSFSIAGEMAQPVRYGAAVSAGSTIWIFGGETQVTEGGTAHRTDVIQRFDTKTGAGTITAHLPTTLSHACAFVLNGDIYIAGGRTDTGAIDSVLRFDPASNSITQVATLPQPQSDAGVAVIDNTAWLVGGEISGPTNPIDTVISISAH